MNTAGPTPSLSSAALRAKIKIQNKFAPPEGNCNPNPPSDPPGGGQTRQEHSWAKIGPQRPPEVPRGPQGAQARIWILKMNTPGSSPSLSSAALRAKIKI